MNELLNSSITEPPEKPGPLALAWHALKGSNFIIPIEENLDAFSINPDQNVSNKTIIFCRPRYLVNLISHCTF